MNRITIIGNLTRDPEYATTQNGTAMSKFTVAVKRRFSDGTDFFPVISWRGLADNVHKYLTKGSKVLVSGEMRIDKGEDNEGNKFTAVSISADEIEFLSAPKQEQKQEEKPKAEQMTMTEVNADDLPF